MIDGIKVKLGRWKLKEDAMAAVKKVYENRAEIEERFKGISGSDEKRKLVKTYVNER